MSYYKNQKQALEFRTANIFGVGVNAVSLATKRALVTAFSSSNKTIYYDSRTNPAYKLPSFLFRFVLVLAAVIKLAAVLFKRTLQLVSAILEIAPRGILYFLSLINLVFSYYSLLSTEWLIKSINEEDDSVFCSNNKPLFTLYVQHDSHFYE